MEGKEEEERQRHLEWLANKHLISRKPFFQSYFKWCSGVWESTILSIRFVGDQLHSLQQII